MLFRDPLPEDPKRAALRAAYRVDEDACVRALAEQARLGQPERSGAEQLAGELIAAVRARKAQGIEAFLQEYGLDTHEGVVLLCVAEALLRIPDAVTADRLIRDKIGGGEWDRHLGQSPSLFVNASTWALLLTGRVVQFEQPDRTALKRMVGRAGEPVIRAALTQAMKVLGQQFVLGRTIGEALGRAGSDERRGVRFSYDMLGEAARTAADAERYLQAYRHAIETVGAAARGESLFERAGVSVKLSALHPRFEFAKGERLRQELLTRVGDLAALARRHNIPLCIDAEEADRLEPMLDVIEALAHDPALAGWDGLGFVVQAYQKRGLPLVAWAEQLAREAGRRLMVRLVKGAYWDTEIKRAQEAGLGYPVFTRKAATDVSYLACARALLTAGARLYAQFATHNAHTVASVLTLAARRGDYEFQRLHGMGEALYEELTRKRGAAVRVYAPVGAHEDLLPYLVRRLLENGANTSFVNRIHDENLPIAQLVRDPVEDILAHASIPHPRIPHPRELYAPERANAGGVDLSDPVTVAGLRRQLVARQEWSAAPIVAGQCVDGPARPARNPATGDALGQVVRATAAEVDRAIGVAAEAAGGWDRLGAAKRGELLRAAADGFEADIPQLLALIVCEGGRTFPDALAEVREAIDFLRYYAAQADRQFGQPVPLPGPTGERNELRLHGRGVFACISPLNFPLSIFVGQVAAALAAGNAVIAKPAEQTPLIAARAIQLMHAAGVPAEVLHFVPGPGGEVGVRLVADERVAGVGFTGSTETARHINRALAARKGPIPVFIAETGGLNAMIADSSALPEQVVADALVSAFNSAGQRCSALRLLFVQQYVAHRIVPMLQGAMAELTVGDPRWLATDVGPVIDDTSRSTLNAHIQRMGHEGKILYQAPLPAEAEAGTFVAPALVEVARPDVLQEEVFGPVLHVVRYGAGRLAQVCDAINASGYGLTLGVHSRLDETVEEVRARTRVGNLYVNRTLIGAVVGVQPFGGEGLSGTGPKAGGPYTLYRYATERVSSINTTAAGGNASLFAATAEDDRQGGDR